VDYVPVCPEVECGMSVPREALRQVGDPAAPRLLTVKTRKDYTGQMTAWARQRVRELEKDNLCGFIFKSRSPSSGMERVKVYGAEGGMPSHTGVGMFARIFMEHFPLLPVEEEGRLHDPVLRENFIERIFVLERFRNQLGGQKSLRRLMEFHARHKLLIMSHSPRHNKLMGRLVAEAAGSLERVCAEYQSLLLEALGLKATVKKHTNVLQHMMGYFKNDLSADEKQELLEVLDGYRRELVPLIVPVTLISHYVRKYGQHYLSSQYYLSPHPLELKLRNHV
jgi:uncharacterized protein YbgA (DUF1722 family)/uncharacterized protein YbbK (DUF523 family)